MMIKSLRTMTQQDQRQIHCSRNWILSQQTLLKIQIEKIQKIWMIQIKINWFTVGQVKVINSTPRSIEQCGEVLPLVKSRAAVKAK